MFWPIPSKHCSVNAAQQTLLSKRCSVNANRSACAVPHYRPFGSAGRSEAPAVRKYRPPAVRKHRAAAAGKLVGCRQTAGLKSDHGVISVLNCFLARLASSSPGGRPKRAAQRKQPRLLSQRSFLRLYLRAQASAGQSGLLRPGQAGASLPEVDKKTRSNRSGLENVQVGLSAGLVWARLKQAQSAESGSASSPSGNAGFTQRARSRADLSLHRVEFVAKRFQLIAECFQFARPLLEQFGDLLGIRSEIVPVLLKQ